jgi:hypothetical protein
LEGVKRCLVSTNDLIGACRWVSCVTRGPKHARARGRGVFAQAKGPIDMEWYQWILIVLLIVLIAVFFIIRKKQSNG